MTHTPRAQASATLLGILAIAIWASLVAVARGTQGHLGVMASGAIANLAGGLAGVVAAEFRGGYLRRLRTLPRKYLLIGGGLFTGYNAALFTALSLAGDEAQVVQLGLVQYLWPALTLAFSVPVLGKKARVWLWPGLLVACAGIYLARPEGGVSWQAFRSGVAEAPLPYLLALCAAVSWALYSNLARLWAAEAKVSAAPLFLAASGAVLAVLHAARGDGYDVPWRAGPLLELAYLAIFPTLLAYVFWEVAMRRGNIVLVASLSLFTPVLSTLITCVYLGVPMGIGLWTASGLVVAGAMICKRSIRDGKPRD